MDTKPSDLNQRSYNIPPRLNLLMMASVLGAVTCAIAAHVGDGIAKKELCFYPQSARVYEGIGRDTCKLGHVVKFCKANCQKP